MLILIFACWVILHVFVVSCFFFQNQLFQKKNLSRIPSVSNSEDPDQAPHIVGPDLSATACKDYQQMAIVTISGSGKELT